MVTLGLIGFSLAYMISTHKMVHTGSWKWGILWFINFCAGLVLLYKICLILS